MNLVTKKRFNRIREKFANGNYDLKTVEWMITEIRNTIWDIDREEFKELIYIPMNILKKDIYVKDYPLWQKKNKQYFLDNLYEFKEKYFIELKGKIQQERYSIDDMVETIEYLIENFNELKENYIGGIEIPLRNIEVSFRNLNLSNKEDLFESGEVFAKKIENALKE